jgi:hypothetical protein
MNITFWFLLIFLTALTLLAVFVGYALIKNLRLKRKELAIQSGVTLIFIVLFAILLVIATVGEKSGWPLLRNTSKVFTGLDVFVKLGLPVLCAVLVITYLRTPKRNELNALLYVWIGVTSLPQAIYILIHGQAASGTNLAVDTIPGMLWVIVVANVTMCVCAFILAHKTWHIRRWRSIGLATFGLIVIALAGIDIWRVFA